MRSRFSAAAALVLVVGGCAFDTTPVDACGFTTGTFKVDYTEVAGNCGGPYSKVSSGGSVPAECVQEVSYSTGCETHVRRSCPGTELEYWLFKPKDFDGFVGKAQVSSVGCFSIYDVVLTSLVP